MGNPESPSPSSNSTRVSESTRVLLVLLLPILGGALAFSSLIGDSITFDETAHLTSGVSYLKTGDFRLAPDHPPLAKIWAGIPFLFLDNRWPGPDTSGWKEGDAFRFGRVWLFERNDGEGLLPAARAMIVVLLLGTFFGIYLTARRIFGPGAALLALTVAVFSPTLLAHGRLVTTDLPATFLILVTLLAFARLMSRITWGNLFLASLSVAALSLTKFSWPLVLPGLAAMALHTAIWSRPSPWELELALPGRNRSPIRKQLPHRTQRALALVGIGMLLGFVIWISIWSVFQWRYSPFLGDDRHLATFIALPDPGQPPAETRAAAWETIMHDRHGLPRGGPTAGFVRWARTHHFLPEAYLYGIAYTGKSTQARNAYLNGEIQITGRRIYFPIAFLIKTPIPILLLLIGGLAAATTGKSPAPREPVLLVGLASFAAIYAVSAIASNLNIGHRHLLPIYPVLIILAGQSAAWWRRLPGRFFVLSMVLWLVGANLWIHPHYLSYFNELIGGPGNGHRYLADSNIDWGQDMKRLARYARSHPDETIKLAYFGSGDPTRYGFDCEMLPSTFPFEPRAELTGGTYVISLNQLLGIYYPEARQSFWENIEVGRMYRQLDRMLAPSAPESERPEDESAKPVWSGRYDRLRRGRLLNRLRERPPDERIGYSLFLYRLTDSDIEVILRP